MCSRCCVATPLSSVVEEGSPLVKHLVVVLCCFGLVCFVSVLFCSCVFRFGLVWFFCVVFREEGKGKKGKERGKMKEGKERKEKEGR